MTESDGKAQVGHYLEWSFQGSNARWRYVLAVFLAFLAWLWGSIPAIIVMGGFGINVLENSVAFLYTFVPGLVLILLIVRFILGRPFWSVGLSTWPPSLRIFGLGLLIQLVSMAVMYFTASAPISWRGFDHVSLFTLAIVGAMLVGLLVQTGFEELFFRGLLAQATYRFVRWAPAVIGVQALFFASLHASNVSNWAGSTLATVPYVLPALAWGWIAWRTGSLLVPMGMHFMNNAFLLLFIQTEGDVAVGLAPMIAETPSIERASLFIAGQVVIAILLLELLIKRGSILAARIAVADQK